MPKLVLGLILIACLGLVCNAQTSGDQKNEFFAGYSFQSADINTLTIDPQRTSQNGVNLAYTRNVTRDLGITGDFSAHFLKTTQDITGGTISFNSKSFNFFIGPQYKFTNKTRVTPFVHALAGLSNNRSSYRTIATGATTPAADVSRSITDFGLALGGGLDVRVNKRVSIRAFQIDYNPVFVQSRPQFGINGGRRFDNVRFSIGIVFK